MRGRKGRFLFTILLVLIVFGLGTKIVDAAEDPDMDAVQEDIRRRCFRNLILMR